MAEESSELHAVSYFLSFCRNQADSSRLLIDHAECHLVRNDAGDRLRRCRTGDRNHIKSYRADACHGLKLLERECTRLDRLDHSLILADRNKGT